jgi:DGQHR domain-containing protein
MGITTICNHEEDDEMTTATIIPDSEWIKMEDDLSIVTRRKTLLTMISAERCAHSDFALSDMNDETKNSTVAELKSAHRRWRYERGLAKDPNGFMLTMENVIDETSHESLRIDAIPFRQLGHDCFVGVIAYSELSRLIVNGEAQRSVTKSRLPKIRGYVATGDGYFGAAVVAIVGDVVFDETGRALHVDSTAEILIMDGQHRWRGISEYLATKDVDADRLGDGLAVVVYTNLTQGEQRQCFSDINSTAMKPNRATMLNFDLRDLTVKFTRDLVKTSPVFVGKTNFLKTRIGVKDAQTFTFSNIVDSIDAMFDDLDPSNYNERLAEATTFWSSVDAAMSSVWEARNDDGKRTTPFASTKNALVAIAKLYGYDVDFEKLGQLDFDDIERINGAAGGTNAAIAQVHNEIRRAVVREG